MPKAESRKPRTCGPCRACCITLGFDAEPGEAPFQKPPNQPCKHLVQIGCGIYPERPPVCRRFECGWISAPNLPESLRPDRCGVMFSTNDHPLQPGAYAVFAHELQPGGLERKEPDWLIGELEREIDVVLVHAGGDVEIRTADPALQRRLERSKR